MFLTDDLLLSINYNKKRIFS